MPGLNGPLQYGHACRSISTGISIMATLSRGDSEEFRLPEEVHGLPEGYVESRGRAWSHRVTTSS